MPGHVRSPSDAEAAAGMTVHGEASVVPYGITSTADGLVARCTLPVAQLRCERRVRLEGRRVLITETVENLSALDRPIAWTEHVTLGPPFLQQGSDGVPCLRHEIAGAWGISRFRLAVPAIPGWERRPSHFHKRNVFRRLHRASDESGRGARLVLGEIACLACLLGYVWERSDFPWIGIWEENNSRTNPPWNGRTVTRGMEFGASRFPRLAER